MVKIRSPGPRYLLPTTTGLIKHDPTRTQAPAFSFGVLTQGTKKIKQNAPGPKYNVRNMNEHGKLASQEASILGRFRPSPFTRTPGPKSYNAAVIEPTSPAYSFGNKRPSNLRKLKVGPGPNKYVLPACIGPRIPDIKAEPAYSILSRSVAKTKLTVPGPKYMLPPPNTYLKAPPRAALLGKTSKKYNTAVPGPNKYFPKPTYLKQEALKGISFGVQHSPEKHLVYFPEDKQIDAFIF